jgi:hypothetical protein
MPRNRYTRLVHDRDEARLDRQIRDTHRLAQALRRGATDVVGLPVVLPATADRKAYRRDRLAQKRRHTPDLPSPDIAATVAQADPTSDASAPAA